MNDPKHNVKRRASIRADHQEKSHRLDGSRIFDQDRLPVPQAVGTVQELVGRLFPDLPPRPRRQLKEAIYSFLVNITHGGPEAVYSFSRNRNSYGRGARWSPSIIMFVDQLIDAEYLHNWKGFYDRTNPANSRQSRISPTPELSKILPAELPSYIDRPVEVRKTREKKVSTGKLRKDGTPRTRTKKYKTRIDHEDWPTLKGFDLIEVERLEAFIRKYNDALTGWEILATVEDETKELYPRLQAIFTDDFTKGGRLYTNCYGHQGLKKAQRRTITFDGEESVELDFNGLHIRLLYHLAGGELGGIEDPYTAVIRELGFNFEAGNFGKPKDTNLLALRDDLKIMLLALINDEGTIPQAAVRARRRLFDHHRTIGDTEEAIQAQIKAERRRELWKKLGLTINAKAKPDTQRVLIAFRKAHAEIENYFLSRIGHDLQRIDSEIAVRIWPAPDLCTSCYESRG